MYHLLTEHILMSQSLLTYPGGFLPRQFDQPLKMLLGGYCSKMGLVRHLTESLGNIPSQSFIDKLVTSTVELGPTWKYADSFWRFELQMKDNYNTRAANAASTVWGLTRHCAGCAFDSPVRQIKDIWIGFLAWCCALRRYRQPFYWQ